MIASLIHLQCIVERCEQRSVDELLERLTATLSNHAAVKLNRRLASGTGRSNDSVVDVGGTHQCSPFVHSAR
jgi:hypothetical protein